MGYEENLIINGILLEAADFKSVLFRNSVGVFETKNGDKVTTGLCKGSSDLIGYTKIERGEELFAVFTGIEVKTKRTKVTEEQRQFINVINDSGGIGMIVYSVQEYKIFMCQTIQAFKQSE